MTKKVLYADNKFSTFLLFTLYTLCKYTKKWFIKANSRINHFDYCTYLLLLCRKDKVHSPARTLYLVGLVGIDGSLGIDGDCDIQHYVTTLALPR